MSKARLLANVVTSTGAISSDVSITAPSVTATTNNLTLSSVGTNSINLNSGNGTQVKINDTYAAGGTAVNYFSIYGRQSGGGPILASEGTDSVISPIFAAKGGSFTFRTTNIVSGTQFLISHTASAVNYVQVTGGATTVPPTISAQGSDATVAMLYRTKGNGVNHSFQNGSGNNGLVVTPVNSTANYTQISSAVTTQVPLLQTLGTDTNISMAFQPKGTGAINLAAGSRGVNISNGGTVTAITRTASGGSYTSVPSVVISAPTTAGGVQATASAAVFIQTVTIAGGGTGYTVNDVLTVVGGTSVVAATLTVTSVSAGVITGVSVTTGGTSYTVLPTNPFSVTGGTGSGATFNATAWGVSATITITNAGSGYIEQPTITFSGGGGSGAAAYATVGSMPIIRSLAGSAATGDSLSFYTPAGESVRIKDQGVTSNGYLQLQGSSATSNGSYVTSSAGSLYLSCAGTNAIGMFTNGQGGTRQFNVAHTASAVNYVQVTGATTGNRATISAQGSDSAVGLNFTTKSNGAHAFYTNTNNLQVAISHVANPVNYLDLRGAVTTGSPVISAAGQDTNIDLKLTPKGSGGVAINSDIKLGSGLDSGTSGQVLTSAGAGASPTWSSVSVTVTPTAVSDQANSSTGYFDLPSGTTEQRPETPSTGMLRYNTTTGYLEYYNATSWSSITSPPAITSISPINYSGNAGTTITINGVFFDSTTTVEFSPSGGSYTQSSSVTFISSNQITATTPLDYTVAQGPLSIKVTTGAGLTAISANSLTTGSAPTWSTASGTLVTVSAASAVSTSVLATDSETGGAIQDYAVTSGALPSGVTLNTSTGAITGTSPSPLTDTTYTFGITATDNAGNTTTERSFNIVVIGTQYSVEYLIVAGGGGGGRAGGGGGGGGAGGMLTGSTTVNASNGYSFTIGAGASGSTSQYSGTLNNGSNSTAFGLTAIGGGGGSSANQGSSFGSPGGNGGSGGGGAQRNGASGGSGTSGQGNNGGAATGSSGGDAGGGGGGKGSAGVGGSGTTTGGAGGSGAAWVNGATYAGGGGGGYDGAGGSGGGGAGGGNGGGGGNATSNTGGGGGGNNNTGNGGNGGSGIIIVRYSGSQKGTGGTVTSAGGYTYHTFTSSGTYTA